jgi:hypothetical protein
MILLFYRIYRHIIGKEKYFLFILILDKKKSIESEIEYLNCSVLYPYNMKALISDTLDYIQILYDREIVYEIEDHFI